MSHKISAIVLDHDGTLTDSEKGYTEYLSLAADFLAPKLGKTVGEIQSLFDRYSKQILAHPENYGWEIDGKIVSPPSDQYLVVHNILDLILGKSDLDLKSQLFEVCYPQTTSQYRPGVRQMLVRLMDQVDVYIVTNSGTDKVGDKLRSILTPKQFAQIHLVGNAKKMIIDESWVGVVPNGAYHGFAGFPKRGAYLQRRHYYDTLNSIFDGDFTRALVVGDIGEMDLALVDYLGGHTTLFAGALTPSWEKDYWGSGSKTRSMIYNLARLCY